MMILRNIWKYFLKIFKNILKPLYYLGPKTRSSTEFHRSTSRHLRCPHRWPQSRPCRRRGWWWSRWWPGRGWTPGPRHLRAPPEHRSLEHRATASPPRSVCSSGRCEGNVPSQQRNLSPQLFSNGVILFIILTFIIVLKNLYDDWEHVPEPPVPLWLPRP